MTLKADLTGKVVFVAGSTFGIGRAIALRLAENGADIVIHGIPPADGSEPAVLGEIRKFGHRVDFESGDLRKYPEVKKAIENAIAKMGKIDILVGSGGGFTKDEMGLFTELKPENYMGLIEKQWLSRFHLARAVVDHMQARGWGKIIFITTDAGRIPSFRESLIGGAAAAVVLSTKVGPQAAQAQAVAGSEKKKDDTSSHSTMDNKISQRQFFPVVPDDIAKAALFLASDGADVITGQILSVNGGLSYPG
jgi:2-hydroxycyclohexanecarboxyl-CoA dehydrogenase